MIRELTEVAQAHSLTTRISSSLNFEPELLDWLNDVPFWVWDGIKHKIEYERCYSREHERANCCFWHAVGLPVKEHFEGRTADGRPILYKRAHPLYDYQKPIIENILALHPTATIKATGMGVTTLGLGLMSWLCLKDDTYRGDSMGVITGPRVDLAKEEIGRIPRLFEGVHFEPKTYQISGKSEYSDFYQPEQVATMVRLNGCAVVSYPSHTIDAARGLDRIRLFFVDEADFFPPGQQVNARHVVERYIGKTHPMVLFNSTPNLPGGLMDTIEHETDSIYKVIKLHYSLGVGKIYSEAEIEEAKKSISFEREYGLKYGVGIGDIFPSAAVDAITQDYPLEPQGGSRVLFADPAFGRGDEASHYGLVGFERRDGILYTVHAEEWEQTTEETMNEHIVNVMDAKKFTGVGVDEHWAGIIRALRNGSPKGGRRSVNAFPVKFSKQLNRMTIQAQTAVQEGKVRISPQFHQLIGQLKGVQFDKTRGGPDKTRISFDQGDCLLMAADYWFGSGERGGRILRTKF